MGAAAAVAYPFAVLGGLQLLEPRELALAAGALLGLRLLLRRHRLPRRELRRLAVPAAAAGLLLALAGLWNDARFLMFLPALLSLVLLAAFARTLQGGPTMVETFARLQHGALSPERVRHCREATLVWCAFFLVNAAVCAALAAFAAPATWALYTGFVAYVAMGILFAGEFLLRTWRFADEPAPALLRRLLPRSRAS